MSCLAWPASIPVFLVVAGKSHARQAAKQDSAGT